MAPSATLDDGLSDQCLLETPLLSCHREAGPHNSSRLVCASSDGQERASDMYAALVALSLFIVPLAVLLNLAVVVTVYMNRRLHTIINVLVTVLCMNNVMWAGMPILIIFAVNFTVPLQCTLRTFFFVTTRQISFSVIVIITVLRYLLVVKNRSFSADRKNVLIFIVFAVGPGLLKFYLRGFRDHSKCREALAWSPDGYAIFGLLKDPLNWVTATVVSTEYASGLLAIAVCYMRIVIKIFKSKRRLMKRRNAELTRVEQRRPPMSISSQHSQAESSQARSAEESGQHRHTTSLANAMQIIRHHNAAKSMAPRASEPGPSRSTANPGQKRVLPGTQAEPSSVIAQTQLKPASAVMEVGAEVKGESAGSRTPGSLQSIPEMVLTEPQSPSTNPRPDPEDGSAASAGPVSRMDPPESHHLRPSTSRDGNTDHTASNNLILRPSNLLSVWSFRSASRESVPMAAMPPRRPIPRRPVNQPTARVDIIATVSMTAFILIFVVVASPLWSLSLANRNAECVIMPTLRIFLYIILIMTGGSAAIVSPFVLVLFSADFRKALRDTFRKLTR